MTTSAAATVTIEPSCLAGAERVLRQPLIHVIAEHHPGRRRVQHPLGAPFLPFGQASHLRFERVQDGRTLGRHGAGDEDHPPQAVGDACGYAGQAYLLNTASGALTDPAPPSGGGATKQSANGASSACAAAEQSAGSKSSASNAAKQSSGIESSADGAAKQPARSESSTDSAAKQSAGN